MTSTFDQDLEALMAVEPRVEWEHPPPVSRIELSDIWTMRLLIIGGVVAVVMFLGWFFAADRVSSPWLYWPTTAIFLYILALTLYEWFCYLGVRPGREPPPAGNLTVDILTTWCPGEPRDMVVSTLKAIQRVRYPHTTYLCDEGDDPLLKSACARLGVQHVTRTEKVGAKAGNINNALKNATGEIAVILDPDHEPSPGFLDRVLGYFQDPAIGFVQCVQGYYNQSESLVARGAAEQSYHFYGPVMTGMHSLGTVQAIGANCAFRRAALDSIGGHATGLAEDMATTLKLYAKGWRSVYVPEMLTRGLVPNTLGAYSKQQLKWACGVWDILIEDLPGAWRDISWPNRLHFLYNGLFYSRGLFVLIGVLIPIVSLFTGQMPWRITLPEFLQWFGPVFAAQILVRQTSQRWLIEPSERGFHLVGGFLMNATWWAHLAGMLSAIRRVRIPYIPTPKDDEASDAWGLAAPNFFLAAASLTAVIYGLYRDWSPFTQLMAFFALANVLVLAFVSIGAQQKTLRRLGLRTRSVRRSRQEARSLSAAACWLLRRHALFLAVPVALITIATVMKNTVSTYESGLANERPGITDKQQSRFLLGLYVPKIDKAVWGQLPTAAPMREITDIESQLNTSFSLVSMYQQWSDETSKNFPIDELEAIRDRNAVPMITWEPTLAHFGWAAQFPETAADRKVFRLITEGKMDYFLEEYASRIRDYGGPVLIRFAHEMDNPQYPWSAAGGNTPEEFVAAWRYVFEFFDGMGATNVAWVWNPWKASAFDAYYPGNDYVDWIGLTVLNYGVRGAEGSWQDFSSLYAPFEDWGRNLRKPVLIAEFGSTGLGGDQTGWIIDGLTEIRERPEILGAAFFDNDLDYNWPAEWPSISENSAIDWRIDPTSPLIQDAIAGLAAERTIYRSHSLRRPSGQGGGRNRVLRSGDDGWSLRKGGEPFLIKGVAYGAGHGWRAPKEPTRRTVEADFSAIAAMGANTVRRYHPHWGDRNILRAAKANDLMILSGFWLERGEDYQTDFERMAELEAAVLDMVRRQKNDPSILMWVIGNEVWGLMKHEYSQPQLTEMRQSYMRFLERVAKGIKQIDTERPVATAFEATQELPGALTDLVSLAPSVDVIGINAYYGSTVSRLNHLVSVFGEGKPWFLSEFGPDGYWDYNQTNWSSNGLAIEPNDKEKAFQYSSRWKNYVEDDRPYILGGVAFSWSDRLEGSSTWFGLTDANGRKKPAYYALRNLWTDHPSDEDYTETSVYLTADKEIVAVGDTLTLHLGMEAWPDECSAKLELIEEATFRVVDRRSLACENADIAYKITSNVGPYRLVARAMFGTEATSTASVPLIIR